MNRLDRLAGIMVLLQSRQRLTADFIATRYGINKRTVYRDIRSLEAAGIPILSIPGEGYSLVEGYRLPPVMLSEEEALGLWLSGQFGKHRVDSELKKAIELAQNKIAAILPESARERLDSARSQYEIVPGWQSFIPDQDNHLKLIREAIRNHQCLHFLYFSQYNQDSKWRTVNPYGLVHYSNAWHLIAWCHLRRDFRDFRINRIQQFHPVSQFFEPDSAFNLQHYLVESAGQTGHQEVRLAVLPDLQPLFEEKYFFGLINVEPKPDHVELTYRVATLEGIPQWLIGFGEAVTVLHPPELKNSIIQLAKSVTSHYSEN